MDALGLDELPADIGVLLHPVTATVTLKSASITVRPITASHRRSDTSLQQPESFPRSIDSTL